MQSENNSQSLSGDSLPVEGAILWQQKCQALEQEVISFSREQIMLKANNKILELLYGDGSLQEILTMQCREAEHLYADMHACVLTLDDELTHLSYCASYSLPASFCRTIDGIEIESSVSATAFCHELCIFEDIHTLPCWEVFKALTFAAGLQASWSHPIMTPQGKILGCLVMFFNQSKAAAEQDIDYLVGQARIAGLVFSHKRSQVLMQQRCEKLEHQRLESTRILREYQETLKQLTNIKARFLSTMSHEIRTPMNGVLGMAELLQHTALNTEQQQYLQAMTFSGKSLLSMIDDLLDHAKIEAGKLQLNPVPFNLHSLLQETLAAFQFRDNEGIELTSDISNDIPEGLIGDPIRLKQILRNLLNNAFKFTRKGYVILSVFTTESDKGDDAGIDFSVRDTGIGMKQAAIDTLSKPFTQIDQYRSQLYGDLGVGLHICQTLVKKMGGELNVNSSEKQGSDLYFHLDFPVTELSSSIEEKKKKQHKLSALNILLVEDNVVNQVVAHGFMKKMGIKKTDLAENGLEAVEKICQQQKAYDLILMDCDMPLLDGLAATKRIRQWEAETGHEQTPIYAMTALVLQEHIDDCFHSGMNDFIAKPVNYDNLQTAFENIMISKVAT
ncbi:MAG: response regulator [Pseudomonadales bacterium]|nr:response regulator [Pseudomonadales bacterium]